MTSDFYGRKPAEWPTRETSPEAGELVDYSEQGI